MRRIPATTVALILAAGGCHPPAPPPPDAQHAEPVLLIAGGWVLTLDAEGTVFENGAVAVAGERIAAVGPAAELVARYPEAEVLPAAGRIVLPGLVNAHTHVPMTLFRGLADDLPLMEWLEDVIFPAEARWVDEEFVRWGTRLACLEMLRGGITTFVDMYYFEDAIADEAARCGLRAVVGETLIDFPAPDNATWDEAVAYTERFLEKWQDHPLITPAVAPHAVYTVSDEHLQQARALSETWDAPLLIHLAEHPSELERVRASEGTTPIAHLDRLGVLGRRTVAAHVVLPTVEEIALLAERGAGVAHCPQSNMKVAAGVAPVPDLLAAGIAVGLGTDGAASNNDLDLWQEIDTAAKLHKVARGDPTVLDARQALAMATRLGARAIDMESEIGSLEAGKRADVVIVDASAPHLQPVYDPYSALVYAAKASDVETVLVNGRVVLDRGRFTTLDPEPILARAAEYRDRILAGFGR